MRILCVLLLVLPLLFPGPCAEGVRRGLALAAGSALPALFPFFVAGELLTVSHADRALSRLLAPLLRRIYALPQAGAAPVVLGLTGGYPVGAAACASLLREGRLSASDARREALFCSCASPGFCIALAGVTLFGSAKTGALLYGIQAVSALLTGIFVSRGTTNGQTIPVSPEPSDSRPFSVVFCSAVRHAAAVSLDVTAFLVTFSAVLTLMEPVFSRAPALRLLSGLLELSGCAFRGISPQKHAFRACFVPACLRRRVRPHADAGGCGCERSRPARPRPRQAPARRSRRRPQRRALPCIPVLRSGFCLCETGLLALRRLRRRARGCYRFVHILLW